MTDRNIGEVMDKIIEIAPDLKIYLDKLTYDMRYRAPEQSRDNWIDLCRILNSYAVNHPKKAELIALINMTPAPPKAANDDAA